MAETNGGNHEERITRLETVLTDFVQAVATDHRQFLTAQILLTDQMRTLAGQMDTLTVRMDTLAVRVDQVEGQVEALVKIVVALHHGDVAVESKEGRGSKFAVRLPVRATGRNASSPSERTSGDHDHPVDRRAAS